MEQAQDQAPDAAPSSESPQADEAPVRSGLSFAGKSVEDMSREELMLVLRDTFQRLQALQQERALLKAMLTKIMLT